VGEREAAVELEQAIRARRLGAPTEGGSVGADLLADLQVAEVLAGLRLAEESRIRESLRTRLEHGLAQRSDAADSVIVRRRPWMLRRPLLAGEVAMLAVVIVLAIASPRSLAALAEPVVRLIERVRVGDNTILLRTASRSQTEVVESAARHQEDVDAGRTWFVITHYGGFGGGVPPGATPDVQRVSSLERLRASSPTRIHVPTAAHRGEPLRFDHALVTPDGWVLAFYGSGRDEVMLSQYPVGGGRSVAFSRAHSRTTPEGKVVVESLELKTEEVNLGGQRLVWDPDPEPASEPRSMLLSLALWFFSRRQETSALRWEADGVSYSLFGRSLTREEAIDLYLSLRPLGD
jgi:hypothetical protein